MEFPNLLNCGQNIVLRQQERMFAGVPQMHRVRIVDTKEESHVVHAVTGSHIVNAGVAANLVFGTVGFKDCFVGLKKHFLASNVLINVFIIKLS